MSGKLYSYPNNFRAQKILITAKYSGFEIEEKEFIAGVTDKSPEFLKKFPLGKVPAFENEKLSLFEPNAIAYYVGNDGLRGGDNEAEVLQWIGVADNDILPAACNWVYPTLGIMQYNKQNTEKAKEEIKKVLTMLNCHLLTRTFLVGERISQGDISIFCTLLMLYQHVLDPEFRKDFKNVNRWFITLLNQKEFKEVLGTVQLCEKMAQFNAKKYNEIFGKGSKKDQAPKKKDQTPKKTKAPAAEALAAAPEPKKEKPKDPWACQPEATMDMDAWKRCFSNVKDEDEIYKYFIDHFPKDNYSVWSGKYKYNDELRMSFMAGNLVAGMFQRIEKLRKHAFASVIVFGTDNNLSIEGIWIWRGHDLAFELSDDWKIDYDSYEWTKLNYDDDATKNKIKEFWSWEGEFDGREFNQGKIYK